MPWTRTTPAPVPGGTSVSASTMWSYCSHTHCLRAWLGCPIRSRSAAIGAMSGTPAKGAGGGAGSQGTVVFGRVARQRGERQVGLEPAAVADLEAVLGDGLTHHGEVEVPALEHRAGLRFELGAQHHEHPLLALGQHHLVGAHAGLAHGHRVEVEADPEAPFVPHLHRRAGEARGAHVLDGHDGAGGHQLQAGLEQTLLGERVADLHGGAQRLGPLAEARGGHGGAAHPVAARLGAEVDDRAADAGGGGGEDGRGLHDAGGEGVDEDVARIARVEAHLPTHGGHAEGVGVAPDACDHARDERAGAGVERVAEAQGVHGGDGTRAHGEHVAQDAAHAGGRALEGFDERGVVVTFHLERDRLAVADVHHARVLARSVDDPRALGEERAEPAAGGLVGAVLVPHGGHDAELGQGGLAPDEGAEPRILRLGQPVGGDQVRRDLGLGPGVVWSRHGRGHSPPAPRAKAPRARKKRGRD